MKSVAGREFAKALEQRGWELLRVQGSHHIYGKKGSIVRLSVSDTWRPVSKGRLTEASDETGRHLRGRDLRT